jgi:hypothetical protein
VETGFMPKRTLRIVKHLGQLPMCCGLHILQASNSKFPYARSQGFDSKAVRQAQVQTGRCPAKRSAGEEPIRAIPTERIRS